MKIAYVANHDAGGNEDERHIAAALEWMGHTVTRIAQNPGALRRAAGHDLLLFHHWYDVDPGELERLAMPKVGWFFDKVWNGRDRWVRAIAPLCTRFFMTDGTFAARSGIPTVRVLRQGIGGFGEPRGTLQKGRWGATVAHVGGVYGERVQWAKRLSDRYGEAYKAFQGIHGRDLYDFCRTTPIIVAPEYPSDDGYWSNRIYLLLGSGAFLVHPRLAGLADEYVDGIHFAGYADSTEMFDVIDYYLANPDEWERIAAAGFKKTQLEFTYLRRCQKLLAETFPRRSTGILGSVRQRTGTT